MKEFFVVANSFAAPFFSDSSEQFVTGPTPVKALEKFVKGYSHPCGLYAAMIYTDANAYHKNKKPLAKWICNHELKKMEATKGLHGYSYLGNAPGEFEINGEKITTENPKEGRIVVDE